MEPRTLYFIAVFVGIGAFAFFTLANPVGVTEIPTPDAEKVLLDCQHSDYRTYIKCLKRQKRHHSQHGDGHFEIDGHCMESCLKKCEDDHECDKKCGHCMKRTKHKHQIITEYETECTDGNCEKNDGLSTTNITTNIDINNVINNCPPSTPGDRTPPCPPCPPGKPCWPGHGDGNGTVYYPPCQTPCYPPHNPIAPPSLPQLTLVPQLTLGLGLAPGLGGGFGGGFGSGCIYPNQWPCNPQQWAPPTGVDCSGCGNPFLRFKCDVSCYPVQGTQRNYGHGRNINPRTPCRSPYCVGGVP